MTYNSRDDIGVFLSSLSRIVRLHDLEVETRISDNGSTDGTASLLLEAISRFPELKMKVQCNNSNIGLSRALNAEINNSSGRLILVCNPDIAFNDSVLLLADYGTSSLMRGLPVAVVPELINEDGTIQRAIYRRYPTLTRLLMTITYVGSILSQLFPQISRDYSYADHKFAYPIDRIEQASAVCVLVDRDTINRLDPFFDPRFPVFWNDVDMIMRARSLGVFFHIVPAARVTHRLSQSSKEIRRSDPERIYMLTYSSNGLLGFARRWRMHPRVIQTAFFLDSIVIIAVQVSARLIGRRRKRRAMRYGLLMFRSTLQ